MHHITSDKRKFIEIKKCDGGATNFDNDNPCVVKGKGTIVLNDKTQCMDFFSLRNKVQPIKCGSSKQEILHIRVPQVRH